MGKNEHTSVKVNIQIQHCVARGFKERYPGESLKNIILAAFSQA